MRMLFLQNYRMTQIPHRVVLSVLGALAAATVQAEVRPHALFSENAVLQQQMAVPVWGTAQDGERVTVECHGQKVMTQATNGQWRVVLNPLRAGGPFTLKISGEPPTGSGQGNTLTFTNILVGEVWLCSGQSNMAMGLNDCEGGKEADAKAQDSLLRFMTVPIARSEQVERDVNVKWVESTPYWAGFFSGVAYYFGRDLRKQLNAPVGLIQCAWGGSIAEAWMPRRYLEADPALRPILDRYPAMLKQYEQDLAAFRKNEPELQKQHAEAVAKAAAAGAKPPPSPAPPPDPAQNGKVQRDRPYGIYNAMLAPLQPYAIRGALWYQGESSAGRAWEYRMLLPTMIRAWRETWGQGDPSTGSGRGFPFLIVQLPAYTKIVAEPVDASWAELRDAQFLAARQVPQTAMVVTTDCGDETNIHPARKEPVGARLALAARALAYGEHIEYSGPIYESVKIEGDRALISFKHVGGGLVARDGALKGFAIAGADKKFVTAQAEIKGDQVVVRSPQVAQPVAVRFGWANYPVVNLWNQAGLPASPFRTDDFPLSTQPKQP